MESVQLTSAMRANLASLQVSTSQTATTQSRLSTGKKVNSALDNPASFFAAQSYNQRAGMLNGLKDNISEGIQMVKAASNGVKAVTSLIEGLRGQLTQARATLGDSANSGTVLGTAKDEYNKLVQQINEVTQKDSSYKGVNFMKANVTYDVAFNEQFTSKLTLNSFDGTASGLTISGGTASGTGNLTVGDIDTTAEIDAVETTLNNALTKLNQESSELSTNLSIMTTRNTFLSDMVGTLTEGADKLVSADQNEEGANMLMLQTRTSLATTALSLSSQAAQSVLRLF